MSTKRISCAWKLPHTAIQARRNRFSASVTALIVVERFLSVCLLRTSLTGITAVEVKESMSTISETTEPKLRIAEAAKLIDVSRSRLRKDAKAGLVAHVLLGTQMRFTPSALDRYVARMTVAASPAQG